MTTFPFQPSANAPFRFQPTLDGQVYTGVVTWNIFGQRWYLNLYNGGGDLVVCKALAGSPAALNIQDMSWANGVVTVTTVNAHGITLAATVNLTISQCVPSAYNGVMQCLITGPSSFTYSLAADPGAATTVGFVSSDINLVWGLFQTSTLVFRDPSQTFEVTP